MAGDENGLPVRAVIRAGHADRPDFGVSLRRLRTIAGMTQEELAGRAGLGVRTIRDLEHGQVAKPRQTSVALLADALDLRGVERRAFVAAARHHAAAEVTRVEGGTLIGRESDIAGIEAHLAVGPPITTLVGVAGVGKTSLALAISRRRSTRDRAVGVVQVSAGSRVADLADAVAVALGVTRADELDDKLAGTQVLLVLDAIERSHRAAVDFVSWVAERRADIRILATGRRALDVSGELVRVVEPLPVPRPETSIEGLGAYAGVRLFLNRLSSARREPVSAGELPALGALVRRLGGLPLALELAAAQGRLLTVDAILDQYGSSPLDLVAFVDLRSGEPVTLRQQIADTCALLTDAERRALYELAVFGGSWPAALAERLIGGPDPFRAVDGLVRRGLLISGSGDDGEQRFRMLDVVRYYATEQLDEPSKAAMRDQRGRGWFDLPTSDLPTNGRWAPGRAVPPGTGTSPVSPQASRLPDTG